MIGADHPQPAIGLEGPAAFGEPATCEGVVLSEACKLVPGFIDRIDQALVGSVQFVGELQVVGRVCEDEIDGGVR